MSQWILALRTEQVSNSFERGRNIPSFKKYIPLSRVMAGSKKNKAKKLLSPRSPSPTPNSNGLDDEDLMDDLLAQLDSRDTTVQHESANIINEMQIKKAADTPEPGTPTTTTSNNSRQSSKSRHQARQVCFFVSLFQYVLLRRNCMEDRRGRPP